MDKPPPKKKRLITKDIESDSDESDTQINEQEEIKTPLPTGQIKAETPVPVNEIVSEHGDEDDKKKQPRLIMKKMVLNNFKSYAGRQVIGPFHKVKTMIYIKKLFITNFYYFIF
jgi:structural maintenance of chromosome 4